MIDAIANLPAPMRVKMTADILARIVQPVAALDLTPLTLLPSARIADGHNVTLTNDNSVVVLIGQGRASEHNPNNTVTIGKTKKYTPVDLTSTDTKKTMSQRAQFRDKNPAEIPYPKQSIPLIT